MKSYVPIFRDLDARGGRKLRTDRQTHTHGTTTVTLAAHACIIVNSWRMRSVGFGTWSVTTFSATTCIRHRTRDTYGFSTILERLKKVDLAINAFFRSYTIFSFTSAYTQYTYTCNTQLVHVGCACALTDV